MAQILDVSELDFANIKAKLVKFMSAQEEFADFDFTGSAMNVLLDVLAYNTHYLGMYTNMSISESFMSSAILRNNIVRRAKEMNYFPKQRTSAQATLELNITPFDNPATLIVARNTQFKAGAFTFVTTEDTPLTKTGTSFSGSITINEGRLITEEYPYSAEERVYTLKNTGVDTDFLHVSVETRLWAFGNDQQLGDEDKEFYYLSEEDDRGIGLFFGDDIISKEPAQQQAIILSYLKCNGSAANGFRTFSLPATIGGYAAGSFTVVVADSAQNGTDGNTIANIQAAAPKYYQAQGRAVTTNDYEAIIHNKAPGVQSVSVWAGEDNIPKRAGSVFLSIKPTKYPLLTPAEKIRIIEILDDYNVVGIIPVIVDPVLIYVTAVATVNYYKERVISNTNITSVALNAINKYFKDISSEFNANLLYSNLVSDIDKSSVDIINSNVEYTVAQNILLQDSIITVTVDYNNEIRPGSILSSEWTVPNSDTYLIKDQATSGNVELFINGIFSSIIGSVDYTSGVVSITGINSLLPFNTVSLSCSLVGDDVLIDRNYLLALESAEVIANGI